MSEALLSWALAFAVTQAVEVPLYRRAGASWATAALASTLTHPVVWFGFPAAVPLAWGHVPMVALAEAFAVGAEALWLRHRGVQRALAWSVAANGASFSVGLVLRALFGVP